MRRLLIIGLPVAILITAAWWFLVVTPINDEIIDQESQLDVLQTQEASLRQQLSALRQVNDRLPEYQRAVADMQRSIPPTPQIDSLIDDLKVLADDTNVVWSAVAFSTPGEETPEGFRTITVNMTVTGQYFELLGYLYGVSELDRLVRIDTLSFSPSLTDEGFNEITLTINAVAFTTGSIVVPEQPEVEEPDIPATTTTTTTTIPSSTTTTAGG